MNISALQQTISKIAIPGKGILAADESVPTITKRLAAVNTESTEETRRAYRELLLSTPDLNRYVAGVILFEETLNQSASDGTPLPQLLADRDILPGIKVDKGLINLEGTEDEQVTQGLDGLAERLVTYREKGAKFAKWRAVYKITDKLPSMLAVQTNADVLARYAAICQANDIVPIVEPEVLLSGAHTIDRCAEVTERVLRQLFNALARHRVRLEYIILKPSMVIEGDQSKEHNDIKMVAKRTLEILRRTVPAAVPTINFLSGGQTPEQATAHLAAMNTMPGPRPWNLSFSYARALQGPCLTAWQGKAENVETAQAALFERAKLNSAAALGEYVPGIVEA